MDLLAVMCSSTQSISTEQISPMVCGNYSRTSESSVGVLMCAEKGPSETERLLMAASANYAWDDPKQRADHRMCGGTALA